MKKLLWTSCLTVALSWLGLSIAQAWSLEEAAKDYKGTEVKVTLKYDMSDKLFIPMGGLLNKNYTTTTTMMVE